MLLLVAFDFCITFNMFSYSNQGHPFSCGITLAKLAAVTMDEHGNETFDTSGALDKLRKVSFMLFILKVASLDFSLA